MRVDYHIHTQYSHDCETSLEIVLERALRVGIGCLCVTDHDTIEGALQLARMRSPEVEIVVGCEFTTEDGSHLIGLGLTEMITATRIPELIQKIKEQDGLVLLPHPFRRGSGIFRNEMRRSEGFVRDVLSATDLVECFNGKDTYANNQRSYRFAVERGLPSVAGSDAHSAAEIGAVYVEYADGDQAHGVSARRIFFPDQPPVAENPMKRRLMELYHRHQSRFPAVVGAAYRASKRRSGAHRSPRIQGPTRMQYEFPFTSPKRPPHATTP
jgi:predicted metal-dependent phosphoesterase TrpH